MATPRVLILRAPGANCDAEAQFAFEKAGARAERVHINRLREKPNELMRYQILVIPGGFTYGDDVAAGKILANQFAHLLGDSLRRFRDAERLILGICNGFQVLCEAHLLDGALTRNSHLHFRCKDQALRIENNATVWTSGYDLGARVVIPVKNGEGCFVADERTLDMLEAEGRVIARYIEGSPNGSMRDIAGITNERGNVVGLMPHPEHAVDALTGPSADGVTFFTSVLKALVAA